ncbi:polyisoprenoid-binding protein [Siphonobacter sp. BAB-5385]|uniref:Polyisoprenoid-binding protein n=1 Tax=Siphonobacter curvatus TaxID=2094562 RepID=A0A2S7IIC1_9BACT|nr:MULTISPECIES: YceI family protein [Siphonobacter]OZI07872.1 polyisoprenoid-binding protein [Siphonobacter sp. BAB-5385]PMD90745.1 polyisoprenoid-binding protein [Siphonobacter sp. BAB-5405]PQA55597.1 polyisoprenoid-binding protein [Siphonobacter curvatus]
MKKLALSLLFTAFSLASMAQSTWKVDKNHAQLKFDVTHTGISTVSGAFTDFDATVTATKEDFSDATFEFTGQTASINTGVEKRDAHLKSPDFFDAAQYPTLTFKSTSLKKDGADKYKLMGNLTLHGVTKPVTLDLWYRGTITNPNNKKQAAGFRATGTIKRSDFGIGSKFPANMLSEEVMITADGEFGKQ